MKKAIFGLAAVAVLLYGCSTIKGMNKQQKGTAAGATGGALLGAALTKGSIWGILAGAAIGGVAGNLIGKKMDQQAKELKQAVPTAEVTRVDEGINMTFNSSLMFKINSAEMSEAAKTDLAAASEVFKKHPDTYLHIEGHTDDTGTDEVNMHLSEKRAQAVGNFLKSQGIEASRIKETWYGESQPRYANDNEENRAKNRRVELGIVADEDMKKAANEGNLK